MCYFCMKRECLQGFSNSCSVTHSRLLERFQGTVVLPTQLDKVLTTQERSHLEAFGHDVCVAAGTSIEGIAFQWQ